MAGFAGRKAPNVSQYIANLNAIPSAHDVAGQQETFGDLEEELAQFTNTEFLDFDTGSFLEQPAPEYDSGQDEHGKKNGSAHDDVKGLDFVDGMRCFATQSQPVEIIPMLASTSSSSNWMSG